MSDLVRTVLSCRPWLHDSVIVDCLELAEWLGPHIKAGLIPLVTTTDLQERWNCNQSTVSRRIKALRVNQLIDASLHPGRGAFWEVHRVGPAA